MTSFAKKYILFSIMIISFMMTLALAGCSNKNKGAEVNLSADEMIINAQPMDCELGIDTELVKFSWKIDSTLRNQSQESYKIMVANDEKFTNNIWDSGWVISNGQNKIPYGGENKLQEKTRYWWKVQIKTGDNGVSVFSEPKTFETDILDWSKTKWVGGAGIKLLRRDFTLTQPVSEIKCAVVLS